VVIATKTMGLKIPFYFQNTSILFWHPVWGYRMEINFKLFDRRSIVYSKLFLKTLCGYEAPRCWCGSGEKEIGGFDKTHIVS
jgi:hypothetical protein